MSPAQEPTPELLADPYESFMHHHLQYYGYFRDEEKIAESSSLVPREHRPKSSDSLLEQESGGSNRDSLQDKKKKLICSLMLEVALLKSKQLLFNHLEGPGVPRLREPRGLFAVPTSRGPLQAPRWPVECEVIKEQIQHIGNQSSVCVTAPVPCGAAGSSPARQSIGNRSLVCVTAPVLCGAAGSSQPVRASVTGALCVSLPLSRVGLPGAPSPSGSGASSVTSSCNGMCLS
uniref:Uncharacterized protein n=1 Tax=Chrysemys picta bellii TaxID=8478 RepID=A0A8C3HUI9_CHRPI